MAKITFSVMDHTGHSTLDFDKADPKMLAAAEEKFRELTGAGFTAAERTGPGTSQVVRGFNAEATETLFIPRLKGG